MNLKPDNPQNFLDGNKILGSKYASWILDQIANDVAKSRVTPKLAVVLVGSDPASRIYVRNKHNAAKKCGIETIDITLDGGTSEEDLLRKISNLANDNTIHGILVQMPLPKHINAEKILDAIPFQKDVDGFHFTNAGKLFHNTSGFIPPCTPFGCIEILKNICNFDVKGKNTTVIGASNIVGRPLAAMLMNESATVTICNRKTVDIGIFTKLSDVIFVATGVVRLLKPDMIKHGSILIDIGINRLESGFIVGDVDPKCFEFAKYFTPVPGGIGPMTIAILMKNVLDASRN